MSNITVIGGTGFAGKAIVKEAQKRGHHVTALSRSIPTDPLDGVTYVQGSALEKDIRRKLLNDAEVVIAAAAPRGDMKGQLRSLYFDLAQEAAENTVRMIVIGGFSSLRPEASQLRFFETGDVPAEYLEEATEVAGVFDDLKGATPQNLDWLFISPAATFGAWANLEDTGKYRVGTDVAFYNENNESKISASDFALAVVDEIENHAHSNENISVAQ